MTPYIILAAIGLALILAFLYRRRKQNPVAGLTFNTVSGVSIASEVPIDAFECAKKIREGLQIAFDDARTLGWTQKVSVGDYKIAVRRRAGYFKNVAYFGDNLAGTADPKECLINVPDGFEAEAVRNECEHIILYWNDRTAYDRLSVSGHAHPLLPALIRERVLGS